MRINLTQTISNTSLQAGDYACYVITDTAGNQGQRYSENSPQIIGEITNIGQNFIDVDSPNIPPVPWNNIFIMFLKNNVVNNSSLKGYYADVTMVHNGPEKAELFAVGSEVTMSSK